MTAPTREDGRQSERTALAWLRTSLAALVVAALLLRSTEAGSERWMAATASIVLLGVVAYAYVVRTASLRHPTPPPCPAGLIAAVSAAVVTVAATATVVAVG